MKQQKKASVEGNCLIPPALPKTELHKLLFRQSETEAQQIKNYVEWQLTARKECVRPRKCPDLPLRATETIKTNTMILVLRKYLSSLDKRTEQ
jgi:hypothetical protein